MALKKRLTRKNTERISWLLWAAFDKTKQNKKHSGKNGQFGNKIEKECRKPGKYRT